MKRKMRSVDTDGRQRKRGAAGRMGTRVMGERVAIHDAHFEICKQFAECVRVTM